MATDGVKAIETAYRGYRFRSRLEARWAVFFDALRIRWEYEQQGYEFDGVRYLPDFWLPDQKAFVEIKPGPAPPRFNVYLAGKMSGWREGVDLRGHNLTGPDTSKHAGSCGNCHGLQEGDYSDEESIVDLCLGGIRQANLFLAWIDSADCYGTLVEIGIAKQAGLSIYLGWDRQLYGDLEAAGARVGDYRDGDGHCRVPRQAMWFAEACADSSAVYDTAAEFVRAVLPELTPEEHRCRGLSRLHQCYLVYGNPWPGEYSVDNFNEGWSCRGRAFALSTVRGSPVLSCGGWHGTESRDLHHAFTAARSARFEHGETPRSIVRA
jgi:hypothetical protein